MEKVIGKGCKLGHLFLLYFDGPQKHSYFNFALKLEIEGSNKMWFLWHLRLGHPNA